MVPDILTLSRKRLRRDVIKNVKILHSVQDDETWCVGVCDTVSKGRGYVSLPSLERLCRNCHFEAKPRNLFFVCGRKYKIPRCARMTNVSQFSVTTQSLMGGLREG